VYKRHRISRVPGILQQTPHRHRGKQTHNLTKPPYVCICIYRHVSPTPLSLSLFRCVHKAPYQPSAKYLAVSVAPTLRSSENLQANFSCRGGEGGGVRGGERQIRHQGVCMSLVCVCVRERERERERERVCRCMQLCEISACVCVCMYERVCVCVNVCSFVRFLHVCRACVSTIFYPPE